MTAVVTPKKVPPGAFPASDYGARDGFNVVIFGYGGAGKTTLLETAQDTEAGADLFVMDLEKGSKSIRHREDVIVWRPPNKSWDDIDKITNWLISTKDHTYKTFGIESLGAMYDLALKKVMSVGAPGQMPSQPEYGKANQLVLDMVQQWVDLSADRGWNVIFTAHAEDFKEESTGTVYIRMKLTPGVITGLYRIVDSVGYLAVDPTGRTDKRSLLLKNTNKVIAKHRQPRQGPQLPTQIENPSLKEILEHVHQIRSYPQKG